MTDPVDVTAPQRAQWDLARLTDGFLTTQLLYVAAKLDIAGHLAAGPLTGPALAEAVGADPALLTRVLRGLTLEGVLAEQDGGRFALTPLGAGLRDGVPGSLRGPIIARGELYYQAAAGMLQTVLDGGRLLLVEALLPERARDQPEAVRMDLHMLVLLGARERTEAQYARLLGDAGFAPRRTVPTRSPAGLSVLEAVPAG